MLLIGAGKGQNIMVYTVHLRNNLVTGLILSIPTPIFSLLHTRWNWMA